MELQANLLDLTTAAEYTEAVAISLTKARTHKDTIGQDRGNAC